VGMYRYAQARRDLGGGNPRGLCAGVCVGTHTRIAGAYGGVPAPSHGSRVQAGLVSLSLHSGGIYINNIYYVTTPIVVFTALTSLHILVVSLLCLFDRLGWGVFRI
jgi:hypothetical protein